MQKPPPKVNREGSKYFRDSNNIDANAVISDDDDFEADLQAAQAQMKQKEKQSEQEEQNQFEEHAPHRENIKMAHEKYNTDKAVSGGISERKKKKKKKGKKNPGIVNRTALAGQDENFDVGDDYPPPEEGNSFLKHLSWDFTSPFELFVNWSNYRKWRCWCRRRGTGKNSFI